MDLLPTLIEAATLHQPGGPTVVPHCPSDTRASRATAHCTEGFSLLPLISNATAAWGRAAFSQFTRAAKCCDCPQASEGVCCACDVPDPNARGDPIMGYTVRVDKYRYTGWFAFNATAASQRAAKETP